MVRSRAADGQSCIIGDETRVIIAEGWPVSTRSSGQPDGGVFRIYIPGMHAALFLAVRPSVRDLPGRSGTDRLPSSGVVSARFVDHIRHY